VRRWAIAAAALLLAGCASAPPPPPAGWSGKLGYRVEATSSQRAQAGSALFELSGNASAGSLLLTSPLGTTLAQAQWSAEGLSLNDGKSQRAFASLDELGAALGEALQGPALPLAALFAWLQDRPVAELPFERDGAALLQLGWRIERPEPQRLHLSQGGMSLRLIVSP
jgi:outer membrane lipoprotein LolB